MFRAEDIKYGMVFTKKCDNVDYVITQYRENDLNPEETLKFYKLKLEPLDKQYVPTTFYTSDFAAMVREGFFVKK